MVEPTAELFVDESIHERQGFIVSAYVAAEPGMSAYAEAILVSLGFQPGRDEFKSGARMHGNPVLQELRDRFIRLAADGGRGVGLVVSSSSHRADLGYDVLWGLTQLVERGQLEPERLAAYFDEGIFRSRSAANETASHFPRLQECVLNFEQDSKLVAGLQIADAVAGAASQILLEHLTGRSRSVPLGEDEGYPEGTRSDLGWVLRMTLRYSLFKGPWGDLSRDDLDEAMTAPLFGYGVFATENLGPNVREAVQRLFKSIWMGCIH